ncbi:diguanylate cyclase (GGDEF) domain-containing protein [Rhodovulum sp. ES.010]|uniref:GGDEF domain-containing protein n=1 Tax=Rhodovulum sp. ES.010 TaxID=1882821 RepID=UPI000928A6ED|nr:GGDEF domain-containing protein [Rhodovulum sp. ES.010]SIO57342.1 diguanylate cyclase (GGDEF) domain-containing protein [Rhodovulum sp. ES.010]
MVSLPNPAAGQPVVALDAAALDRLMPMHLRLDRQGVVRQCGPTIARFAGGAVLGRPFAEVVCLRRPRPACDMDALLAFEGMPLKGAFVAAPTFPLKGLVVGLPEGEGALLNLSMGISLIEAVGRFDLTLRDFAPTDLAVELLYLAEAKSAVTAELHRLAQRLNGARVTAEAEAATDTLTGLANRRRLDAMLARFLRDGQDFSVMQVDLDYFKDVNDTYGHATGDEVLRVVAEVLAAQFRPHDLVARMGGDEFTVLIAGIVDPVMLDGMARRVIARLEQPINVDGITARVSASIGIAQSNRCDRSDAAEMLYEADVALYESKRQGRGRSTIASAALLGGPCCG